MKRTFLLIIFFLVSLNIYSQFYFIESTEDLIEISFLRKKMEVGVDQSFFNAVKIKNPSNKEVSFLTNFSFPASWTFMGEKNQQISLGPNDSIIIPYRAAPSLNAKGDIGYAIVASLSDLKGNTFKNEYSFVNIPKIQSILFNPLHRVEYVSDANKKININLKIANNGNTDETIYLTYTFDNTLHTDGLQNGIYTSDLILSPFTDTVVSLPVKLVSDENYFNKKFHRVGIKLLTNDTTISNSVWINELESNFQNSIPNAYSLLSAEVNAQNLFKDVKPFYAVNMYGNVLLKKDFDIFYSAQITNINSNQNIWDYGRYLTRFTYKKFILELGDVSTSLEQSMYGRGANFKFTSKKLSVNTIITKSVFSDKLNYGVEFGNNFDIINYSLGTSFSIDKNRGVDSKIGFIKIKPKIKNIGSFNFIFATSLANWYIYESKKQIGYFGSFMYSKKIKNTSFSFRTNIGQREYFGNFNGRTEIVSNIYHPLKNGSSLQANYYLFNYAPSLYIGDQMKDEIYNNFEELKLSYSRLQSTKLTLVFGISGEKRTSNNFYNYLVPIDYQTGSGFLFTNIRYKTGYYESFGFSLKGGGNFTMNYPTNEFNENQIIKNWPSFIITGDYRSRKWGIYSSYYHGPYTMSEQFNNFYTGFYAKTIRVLPYFELSIIPKYLRYVNRTNFSYDITSQVNRLNSSSDVIVSLPDDWELGLTGTIGFQSNIDKVTEEKYNYSSAYFEFKIKKDINANQPRYQYHDLDVYFFNDLNGNGIKDPDEPGLNNILLNIRSDEKSMEKLDFNTTGYFMPMDLLSDNTGHISYENIPNGFYTIEYNAINSIGSISSETNLQSIYFDGNKTLYIPFTENNKIFGKAILNRSKLSNLGAIDVSNIKVTAEDSYGKKYSSLTNKEGNFTIYVPSVDKYKVRVNNIFFENFELEQNDYEVQLNGYRQFEVNFIFNEKKRKINFTASYDYGARLDGPGVEIVRRTNLGGTVKDATTLQPISATIRIVDGKGNEITSANSNAKTGVFTTSFVAGDDYNVEVMADNYWFYAEKLYSNQIVTFKNLKKDILVKAITVGSIIPMNTLNFASGSAEIPPTSFPELERLLKVLRKNPSVKIDVHGHADDLEIRETQEDLALERAKIIAKYLIANGYNRVKYSGHSNTRPIADNDTDTGRAQNRRVEIVVTSK